MLSDQRQMIGEIIRVWKEQPKGLLFRRNPKVEIDST